VRFGAGANVGAMDLAPSAGRPADDLLLEGVDTARVCMPVCIRNLAIARNELIGDIHCENEEYHMEFNGYGLEGAEGDHGPCFPGFEKKVAGRGGRRQLL